MASCPTSSPRWPRIVRTQRKTRSGPVGPAAAGHAAHSQGNRDHRRTSERVGQKRGDAGGRWQARLEASDLAAMDQGRPVTWQEPLVIDIAVQEGPGGPIVDAAHRQSSFCRQAAGTIDKLLGSSFDWLASPPSRPRWSIWPESTVGTGRANFAWERADQTFTARPKARPAIASGSGRPAGLDRTGADGRSRSRRLARLDEKPSTKLSSRGDRITLPPISASAIRAADLALP